MRVTGTFKATNFQPVAEDFTGGIRAALPVGVMRMEKLYSGEVSGRSATIFSSAFDPSKGVGFYTALESFEGTIGGRSGTFIFMHSASTSGRDRSDESFHIVAHSGTGDFEGIAGAGGMEIDDASHRIWFDLAD